MHAGSASSQLRAGTLLAARNVLDTALQRRNLLLDSISSSNRRIRRTQRIRERYDDDNNLNIGHDVVDPVRHESNLPAAAVTTPAVHTFVDKAAQRRTGLLRAIPALTRRRRRGGSQLSDHSHYLHKTLEVVSIKTEKIRQHLVKQMPNTGFFYGISPKLVQTYTTDATPSVKPLPLKQAVTLTLDELRSIRQEMESLRDEIRALKRNMLGEEGDEALLDPEAVLAQKRKKQREFDRIGREVERWAQHLLFEQDGEVDGWKEVACNKVMQASLNPDGRTVAYLKWMKDSRGSYASPDDDREYPCIKVFSTIDAPLEVVCQYLSDERKMAEYNDLIVQHKEVEEISSHGKICWGQTPAILFIQPRDFLTYCHHVSLHQ